MIPINLKHHPYHPVMSYIPRCPPRQGHYTEGAELIDSVLDVVRKEAEGCALVQRWWRVRWCWICRRMFRTRIVHSDGRWSMLVSVAKVTLEFMATESPLLWSPLLLDDRGSWVSLSHQSSWISLFTIIKHQLISLGLFFVQLARRVSWDEHSETAAARLQSAPNWEAGEEKII